MFGNFVQKTEKVRWRQRFGDFVAKTEEVRQEEAEVWGLRAKN